MDPILIPTLAAIISALVGGAAGEAGKSAWESLASLVRRRFGHDRAALAAVERPGSLAPEQIARLLADRAQADPEFEASLAVWVSETRPVIRQRHDVTNTISGDAHVSGPVIQAGDVHGSISFGGDRHR